MIFKYVLLLTEIYEHGYKFGGEDTVYYIIDSD